MDISNRCRACLSETSLNPIFKDQEDEEKYESIFSLITGVSISRKDEISLQICTKCVNFINKSIEFRRMCEESTKSLIQRLSDGVCCGKNEKMIDETNKPETYVYININNYFKWENSDMPTMIDDYNDEAPTGFVNENKKLNIKTNNCKNKILSKVSNDAGSNIECTICRKVMKLKSYKKHYKRHTGFDIVCEYCGKKFISHIKLRGHWKAKHGYEKTDKCSFCDYRASNNELVKIHERLHTGEKPYICKECGVGFHRNSTYLQHLPIHYTEKTVKCDQCPAMFKSTTFMRIHKNRCHKINKYQYICGLCKNSFARRYNVVKHLKRIHCVEKIDEIKHVERVNV